MTSFVIKSNFLYLFIRKNSDIMEIVQFSEYIGFFTDMVSKNRKNTYCVVIHNIYIKPNHK